MNAYDFGIKRAARPNQGMKFFENAITEDFLSRDFNNFVAFIRAKSCCFDIENDELCFHRIQRVLRAAPLL